MNNDGTYGNTNDIYYFHNTFDATDVNFGNEGAAPYYDDSVMRFSITSDAYLNNVNILNNIWYYKINYRALEFSTETTTGNTYDGNLYWQTTDSSGADIWYYNGKKTLSYVQANYITNEGNEIEVNPAFNDQPNHDYTLSSTSQAIDAGAWLTKITSSTASGTTFRVADPNWFYDGWGIPGEIGDVIKTENGQTARITSINYDIGAITVSSSISWTNGEGIGLDFKGSKPDIGAKEYSYSSDDDSSISPPKALTIKAN